MSLPGNFCAMYQFDPALVEEIHLSLMCRSRWLDWGINLLCWVLPAYRRHFIPTVSLDPVIYTDWSNPTAGGKKGE
jgi:hypothetical protein